MSVRTMTALAVGAFMLSAPIPSAAQQRGTIEFGAFANHTWYDDALRMDNGWGAGGRVGAFIFPRLSVEFEVGRRWSDRPEGLESVEVEAFAARLLAVPLTMGPLSVLLGGAMVHTDWENGVSDGWQGLVGLKLGLGSAAALRIEGLMDFHEDDVRNRSLQVGLSLYRHPATVAPAPTMITRVDTIRTVRVDTLRAAAALPTGTAATLCLATGEAVEVLVTAQGDTLVGPDRASVRTLRQSGVAFSGEYARGRPWFEQDENIAFERRLYQKSGGELRLGCPDILRVGEFMGVPLFVRRDAARPYQQLYVPVRPGVWQAYENLRATRG